MSWLARLPRSNVGAVAAGSAFFLAGLVFYSLSRYPGPGGQVWFGDSVAFQYQAISRSLGHSPGYPQYLALTRAWVAVAPFGRVAEQVNFVSAFWATASLVVLFRLSRELGASAMDAGTACLVLGLSCTFFQQATEAEVYSLNTFWVLATLLCAERVLNRRDASLLPFAVVYGLSFGNHQTMILLAPALVLAFSIFRPELLRRPSTYGYALLSLVLAVSQYAYTYTLFVDPTLEFRHHRVRSLSFEAFVQFSTGAPYRKLMFGVPLRTVFSERLPHLLRSAHAQNGWWIAMLGAVGLALDKNLYPARRVLLFGSFLTYMIWGLTYDIWDIAAFYTPLWAILYLGIAASSQRIITRPTPRVVGLVLLALVSFYEAVVRRGHYRPPNERLALVSEYVNSVPPGSSFVPFQRGNSSLSMLFRYLEKTEDLGRMRLVWSVQKCVADLYFVESSGPFIHGKNYESEPVKYLPALGEELRRMRCD